MNSPVPYWRLSGYYFFYFAFVGAMSPYWGPYLRSLGFSALEIGVLMSLLAVMRIFSPTLWGWIADRSGKRVAIVQLAALLSLLAFAGVFAGQGFWWLFAVMSALSFFWSASLPLVEATTFSHLGERTDRYGHIRLWGSVGFIVTVVGLGYVLDVVAIRHLPWMVMAMLAGVALFARYIPEAEVLPHHTDHEPVWAILRRPEVLALVVSGFLMSAAHGPYYSFYSIYLEDHGYSKSHIGWLWALGVICEIGVFIWLPRLFQRYAIERVLLASFAIAVVRFLMIAWCINYPEFIILAQVLHAATFGAYHASAVALVNRFFKGRHQAKGQAIYNGVSFGAGGTLGSLYAGQTWETLGASGTFSIAAGCALVAMLLVGWKLRPAAE
jgi:MFS transporter, PPP family, 3-phenylpropionic acid transporter